MTACFMKLTNKKFNIEHNLPAGFFIVRDDILQLKVLNTVTLLITLSALKQCTINPHKK